MRKIILFTYFLLAFTSLYAQSSIVVKTTNKPIKFINSYSVDVYFTGEYIKINGAKVPHGKCKLFLNKDRAKANSPYYIGDMVMGKEEGKGVGIFDNGKGRYEGEWKNGRKDGYGIEYNREYNLTRDGYWNHDFMIKGKEIHNSGEDIYEGEFKWNGGKGTITFGNGDKYKGKWSENGSYMSKYSIRYEDGGTMTYANGDVYEGEWYKSVVNKKSGKGKMIYANGDIYEGHWCDDKKSGKGKMIYANGNIYEGEWDWDNKRGQGTMMYATGDKYVGMWSQDERQGTCILNFANGDRFEGTWRTDLYSSLSNEGTMYYADGTKIIGSFNKNMEWTYGTKYSKSGKEVGYFFNHKNYTSYSDFVKAKEVANEERLSRKESETTSARQNTSIVQTRSSTTNRATAQARTNTTNRTIEQSNNTSEQNAPSHKIKKIACTGCLGSGNCQVCGGSGVFHAGFASAPCDACRPNPGRCQTCGGKKFFDSMEAEFEAFDQNQQRFENRMRQGSTSSRSTTYNTNSSSSSGNTRTEIRYYTCPCRGASNPVSRTHACDNCKELHVAGSTHRCRIK